MTVAPGRKSPSAQLINQGCRPGSFRPDLGPADRTTLPKPARRKPTCARMVSTNRSNLHWVDPISPIVRYPGITPPTPCRNEARQREQGAARRRGPHRRARWRGTIQNRTGWQTDFVRRGRSRARRQQPAAGGYTGVEVDEVGSDASRDRVDRFPDQAGTRPSCPMRHAIPGMRVVAAEIPDPSVIDIGRAKPSAHIPNNNVGVLKTECNVYGKNPATAIAVLQARTKREGDHSAGRGSS